MTDGHGVPIGLAIDGANLHDRKLVRATIESLVALRLEATEGEPRGMCLDKGYDYDAVREVLVEFGFTAHIKARGEEAKELKAEAGKPARRWVMERSHTLDEPLSAHLGALGQEAGELHPLFAFRLCLDRVSCCWAIRIGTKRAIRSHEVASFEIAVCS